MATRGDAQYRLTAKDKSGPAFKSFRRSLGNAAKGIAKVAGGALAAGIGGFAVMAKSALDSADRVQKLSQQLGASTELLSELRGIASLSGTNLEAVGKAIGNMSKNIGNAQRGLKTQTEAFQMLGLSVRQLQGLSVDQQFELIGSRLASMRNESLRAAAGAAIFGGKYKDVLQIFSGGLGAFRAMRKEQQALGRSLSVDQVNGAAAANDAMDRLSQTVQGFVEVLTLEFAPSIAAGIETLKGPLMATINFVAEGFGRVGRAIGGLAAAAGALAGGNFREAGSIASSALGDFFSGSSSAGDDEGKELLREMARNTARTANALAGG